MENENLLTAYHESARVVFAYLNGFTCDSMELPGKDSNANSKLNAGSDITFVQTVLSGNPLSLSAENLQHGTEVARKLMTIYCAGTCAEIFFQNNHSRLQDFEEEYQSLKFLLARLFLKCIPAISSCGFFPPVHA